MNQLKERLQSAETELELLRTQLKEAMAERERLLREAAGPRISTAELDYYRSEIDRLRERLREIERRYDETQSRLSDEIRRRDAEIRSLTDEVAALRRSTDDAAAMVARLEQACKVLAVRLHRVETGARGRPAALGTATSRTAAQSGPTPTRAQVTRIDEKTTSSSPAPGSLADTLETSVIIHLEDDKRLCEIFRSTAARWSIPYIPADGKVPTEGNTRRLLCVNLMLNSRDPLEACCNVSEWGIEKPAAFLYIADESRGIAIGYVELIPPPFDIDVFVSQLIDKPKPPQRVLLVSDAFEQVSRVRDRLGKENCTASVAFDGRQALDLAVMTKPNLVVIDLNLPKGEALRVVARLRTSVQTQRIPFVFNWAQPIAKGQFAEQARRAVRDIPLKADDISRALSRVLGPGAGQT